MIRGIFHAGSGLGNQLHRYVATRVLALDKGYDFSMMGEPFKGKSFMDIDMGVKEYMPYHVEEHTGKVIPHTELPLRAWAEKTPYYNPEFNFIEDNTIIDGEFQDERYFEHRLNEISGWLKVEPIDVPDDVCVIGFRGGEFYQVDELGLPKEYFEKGIEMMKEINPNMRFEVHTDDEFLANWVFSDIPNIKIIHDIGINWRSIRHARYAIIANSSFYILPRLLKQHEASTAQGAKKVLTIAPRYWDRYNIKKWERPYNYYKCFTYL